MTEHEYVSQLVQMIHEQNANYMTIIVAILAVFLGFQFFLSSQQAKKIKEQAKNEIRQEYHLEEFSSKVDELKEKGSKIQGDLIQEKIYQQKSLTEMIVYKVESLANESNKNTEEHNLNDLDNYLNEFILLNVTPTLKILSLNSIKTAMEGWVSKNSDEVNTELLSQGIIKMNMALERLERDKEIWDQREKEQQSHDN